MELYGGADTEAFRKVKFIHVIRDPVERYVSWYRHIAVKGGYKYAAREDSLQGLVEQGWEQLNKSN